MADHANNTDKDRRHAGRRDQRRPDLDCLSVIGPGKKPRAEPGHRAGRQFTDDRADKADRDGDLQRLSKISHKLT